MPWERDLIQVGKRRFKRFYWGDARLTDGLDPRWLIYLTRYGRSV